MNLQFDSANEYEDFIKAVRNGSTDKTEAVAVHGTPTVLSLNDRTITVRQLAIICRYVQSSDKIAAIKYVRSILGCGLKEGKDLVEGSLPSEL